MFKALKRDRAFYGYLLRLTGPIALQNLITFSLGLIDTLMVSQLGNNEMAAVTAANVPVFLLISIVFGVQSGVGSVTMLALGYPTSDTARMWGAVPSPTGTTPPMASSFSRQ